MFHKMKDVSILIRYFKATLKWTTTWILEITAAHRLEPESNISEPPNEVGKGGLNWIENF